MVYYLLMTSDSLRYNSGKGFPGPENLCPVSKDCFGGRGYFCSTVEGHLLCPDYNEIIKKTNSLERSVKSKGGLEGETDSQIPGQISDLAVSSAY